MTGLLVIATIAVVAFVLVLLGAPGLFRPLVTYKIYFDNAAGIKQGAPVMLAGRKIGQVQKLILAGLARGRKARTGRPTQPFIRPSPTPAPLHPMANRNLKLASMCRWTKAPKFIAMRARS